MAIATAARGESSSLAPSTGSRAKGRALGASCEEPQQIQDVDQNGRGPEVNAKPNWINAASVSRARGNASLGEQPEVIEKTEGQDPPDLLAADVSSDDGEKKYGKAPVPDYSEWAAEMVQKFVRQARQDTSSGTGAALEDVGASPELDPSYAGNTLYSPLGQTLQSPSVATVQTVQSQPGIQEPGLFCVSPLEPISECTGSSGNLHSPTNAEPSTWMGPVPESASLPQPEQYFSTPDPYQALEPIPAGDLNIGVHDASSLGSSHQRYMRIREKFIRISPEEILAGNGVSLSP